MKGMWATYILDNGDFDGAEVLEGSIIRSGSHFPLLVLVPSTLEPNLMEKIRTRFNSSVMEVEIPDLFEYEEVTYLKLHCWNLSCVGNTVLFVPPNAVVLKNLDHLLRYEDSKVLVNIQGEKNDGLALKIPKSTAPTMYGIIKRSVLEMEKQGLDDMETAFLNTITKHCDFESAKLLVQLNESNTGYAVWDSSIILLPKEFKIDNLVLSEDTLIRSAAEYLNHTLQSIKGKDGGILNHRNPSNEPIAIIGASCKFPKSESLPKFWENLLSCVDCISQVPPHRWTTEYGCDPNKRNNSLEAGFLKGDISQFDKLLFGMGQSELITMDPQHRLLLQLLWEGVEHAGVQFSSLRGPRTSLYVGAWTQEYRDLMHDTESIDWDLFRTYTCNGFACLASRLARFIGATGDVLGIESGCASSTQAMGESMRNLRDGRSDIAFALGVNLLNKPYIHPDVETVCCLDARCKSFDARANGYVRSEGAAVVVLKRLSDACRDGDRVLGILSGYGVLQDSFAQRFGRPSVAGESDAMRAALKDATIFPEDVSYVEGHGTGTVVGDQMEVEAIRNVYTRNPLHLGAVKSNIGHTESCSGLASVIKVMKSLEEERIPGNLHFQQLNPDIDLDNGRIHIVDRKMEYPRVKGNPRYCAINNIGLAGTNTHLIMEEVPEYVLEKSGNLRGLPSLPSYIIPLSAKNRKALGTLRQNFSEFVMNQGSPQINDLAYSCSLTREHWQHRGVILARDAPELLTNLASNAVLLQPEDDSDTRNGKICFLFPGQGCQIPQMGKILFETVPVFRQAVLRCEKYCREKQGTSVIEPMYLGSTNTASHFNQVALFVIQYALAVTLLDLGIVPDLLLGHSLGEYAAATMSGVLTVEEALLIIMNRMRLLQYNSETNGKMAAVAIGSEKFSGLVDKFHGSHPSCRIDLAGNNGPNQCTVAGSVQSMQEFQSYCKGQSITFTPIECDKAYHSHLVDPVVPEFTKIVTSVEARAPLFGQFISTATKEVYTTDTKFPADYWVRHMRDTVRFREACEKLSRDEPITFVEIGPKMVLSSLLKQNRPLGKGDSVLPCLGNLPGSQWDTFMMTLAQLYLRGKNLNWKVLYGHLRYNRITLPHHPMDMKRYWFQPKKVKHLVRDVPQGQTNISSSQSAASRSSTQKGERCTIDLADLQHSYLIDHALGDKVIFPCAAFVETILRYLGQSEPLEISEFKVKAALKLEQGKTTQLLTRAESGTVTVTSERKKGSMHHCAGKYGVLQNPESFSHPLEIPDTSRDWRNVMPAIFYAKVAEVGINFGPSFCMLSSIHVLKDGGEVLTSVGNFSMDTPDPSVPHPLLIDAMIQTALISRHGWSLSSLVLPVMIGKIRYPKGTSWNVSSSSVYYIHSKVSGECKSSTVLMDENFLPLLELVDLEFVQTNLKQALASINKAESSLEGSNDSEDLPHFYEEVWVKDTSFLLGQGNPIPQPRPLSYGDADPFVLEEEISLNKALGIQILMKFRDLDLLVDGKLEEKLLSFPGYTAFTLEKPFRNLLSMLEADGYCKVGPSISVQWNPGSLDFRKVQNELENHLQRLATMRVEYDFGNKFISLLDAFLLTPDEISPLSILFPKDKGAENSAIDFYSRSRLSKTSWDGFATCFEKTLETLDPAKPLRILEIGGGTGSCTKGVLDQLQNKGFTKFDYTFTDISSAFFLDANSLFEGVKGKWRCRVFDAEKDPKVQGFAPWDYDIVIAAYVIHATSNIKRTLSHVYQVLKPGGLFLLLETFEAQRCLDLNFGLLPGYWNFIDFELRKDHCLLSPEKWKKCLVESGFDTVHTAKFSIGGSGVAIAQSSLTISKIVSPATTTVPTVCVLSDKSDLATSLKDSLDMLGCKTYTAEDNLESITVPNGNKLHLVYVCSTTEGFTTATQASQEFLKFCKQLTNIADKVKRAVIISRGAVYVDSSDFHEFSTSSAFMGFCRTMRSEYQLMSVVNVDIEGREGAGPNLAQGVLKALFETDMKPLLSMREGRWYHATMKQVHIKENLQRALEVPSPSDSFELSLPESRRLDDICFTPVPLAPLGPNQVRIDVKAYGVNFRDVFVITKPSKEFDSYLSVCSEYGGIITEVGSKVEQGNRFVGQRVCGANFMRFKTQRMQSHLALDWEDTVPIPDSMAFEDGATLSISYATAYHSLFDLAKLEKGQTVLIHSAAGGLGLMAIQLAQQKGIHVVATAGSERKRGYLKDTIGLTNIFDSRSLKYSQDVLAVTKGKGVDAVINCITGEGFVEATLKCCSKGAKFVEVSRLNIWSPERFNALRPDVQVFYVNLGEPERQLWLHLMRNMEQSLREGSLKAIPFTRFQLPHLVDAFKYIMQGHHIGKLVVMKETNALFSPNKTYLITGGLSGVGLEVALMLGKDGARNIVLVSRSIPTPQALEKLEVLKGSGVSIHIKHFDVGNRTLMQNLINEISSSMPPLGGIFHSAGTLSDNLLSKMEPEQIATVYSGKVEGAWHLHELTKNMLTLEYFVLFSSAASVIGAIGQANHAAANSFLDQLARYREAKGYPGLSINWGQWGETGSATAVVYKGVTPMTTASAIRALEVAMMKHYTNAAIFNGSIQDWFERFPWMKRYIEEVKAPAKKGVTFADTKDSSDSLKPSEGSIGFQGDRPLKDMLDVKEGRLQRVAAFIRQSLASLLQLDLQDVQENVAFESIGLDSLIAIELKNVVQSQVEDMVNITSNTILEHNTVQKLSSYIENGLEKQTGKRRRNPSDCSAITKRLIEKDRQKLKDSVHLPLSSNGPVKPGDIRTVLITGVTGVMGPSLLRALKGCGHPFSKIYCLVRPSSKVEHLKSDPLIEIVYGDLNQDHLGMGAATYSQLASEVDAIFHFGAYVNHVQSYGDDPSCHLRNTNVLGTIRVLTFATQSRVKWVFYASTFVCVFKVPAGQRMPEVWPKGDEHDQVSSVGYTTSKYVAELMVRDAAVEFNLPIKMLRFPAVIPEDGVDSTHFGGRILACLKSGKVPEVWAPMPFLSVQDCTKLAAKVCLNSNAPSGVYHIIHPKPLGEPDLVKGLHERLGTPKPVKTVPLSEFVTEQKSLGKSRPLWPFIDIYDDVRGYEELIKQFEHIKNWKKWPQTYYKSSNLDKYLPGWENEIESEDPVSIMAKYLDKAKLAF